MTDLKHVGTGPTLKPSDNWGDIDAPRAADGRIDRFTHWDWSTIDVVRNGYASQEEADADREAELRWFGFGPDDEPLTAVTVEFFTEGQQRAGDGKWTKSGGMLSVPVGIESIPAGVMGDVNARTQDVFGMGAEELVGRMADNLLDLAENGNPAHAGWYRRQHDTLAAAAKSAGFEDPEIGVGTLAAMTAVTSAETTWEHNLRVSTSIAYHLGADTQINMTQAILDDYQSWSTGRTGAYLTQPVKKGKTVLVEGVRFVSPLTEATAAHLATIGGTLQPDGSVTIGIRTLAERYPGLAAARMPGPGVLNTDFEAKAVHVFLAGRAGDVEAIDRIVRGPKERSFTNNLTHPDDDRSVTLD